MLTKLIKYEIKAYNRIMLPLYLAMCGVIAIVFIAFSFPLNKGILLVIPGLMSLIFILSVIGLMAATIILAWVRFYKNLVTGEGYLMFTLPVKTEQIILSKLIVGSMYVTGSILFVILSVLAISKASYSLFNMNGFDEQWHQLIHMSGVSVPVLLAILVILYIIAIANTLLTYYASIAIGQKLSKNKLLGTVIGYLLINAVYQIVSVLVIGVIYLLGKEITFALSMVSIIPLMLTGSILLFFIIRNYLTYKLNLE